MFAITTSIVAEKAATPKPPAPVPAPMPAPTHMHGAFHTLLSELNPLQYLPVIGTIYRAVTGDTIPETARIVGSMVVSGLTGGPVGLAINVGTTLLEKASGIDPERIGQRVLAAVGLGGGVAPSSGHLPQAVASKQAPPARAWSEAQLAAYGVQRTGDGELRLQDVTGADVLNGLEMARLTLLA